MALVAKNSDSPALTVSRSMRRSAHDGFDLRGKPRGDARRQDLEQLLDRLRGELAAAEDAGQRAEEDAEREQRDDEREGHRAGHGEAAVLVKPVNGLEQSAVALHSLLPGTRRLISAGTYPRSRPGSMPGLPRRAREMPGGS